MDTPSYYDPNDRLVEAHVAATRLGVHRETIYRWMRKGWMFYVARGPRRKLIRESEIARQLENRRSA